MRVLVSGSTGLVGSAVVHALSATGGHEIARLVRREARGPDEVSWQPSAGQIDTARLEGLDAVVHLAGENIAQRRWSAAQKARIRDSRVGGTDLLCRALAGCARPPHVLVAASAIGYYGADRGDEVLTENSAPGQDFLAATCVAWEQAAAPLRAAGGCRIVHARIGVVLSPRGGALHRMLTPFRLGLGGRLGSGRQYMSWIAIDDVAAGLLRAVTDDALAGPCNLTAPQPVTNAEFTATLARVLRRPAFLPAPAFALRLAFGEMADALLLSSTRVEPRVLLEHGHAFGCPELEGALRHLLAES